MQHFATLSLALLLAIAALAASAICSLLLEVVCQRPQELLPDPSFFVLRLLPRSSAQLPHVAASSLNQTAIVQVCWQQGVRTRHTDDVRQHQLPACAFLPGCVSPDEILKLLDSSSEICEFHSFKKQDVVPLCIGPIGGAVGATLNVCASSFWSR